jgi:hypothetical protein
MKSKIKQTLASILMAGSILTGATAINSGCSYIDLCAKDPVTSSYCEIIPTNSCKTYGYTYIKKLGSREYLLPYDVYEMLEGLELQLHNKQIVSAGKYLPDGAFSPSGVVRSRFKTLVESIGYTEKQAENFARILEKSDTIIIRDTGAIYDIDNILKHERTHREFNYMSRDKINLIRKVHSHLNEKYMINIYNWHEAEEIARTDINEFFAFLVAGNLDSGVLKEIKNKFPDAYNLYQDTLKKVEVIENDGEDNTALE